MLSFRNTILFKIFAFVIVMVTLALYSSSINAQDKGIKFSYLTLPPASGGKPDSIVVLFHGGGSTAEDFLFLGAFMAEALPNSFFVAFNAPYPYKKNPSGKLWFKAKSTDKKGVMNELNHMTSSLNRQLDALLKKYNLPAEKMAFVGFSQGVKMALHMGLRRPNAGVVGLSGGFAHDPDLKNPYKTTILLVHGQEDQMAPPSLSQETEKHLKVMGIPVELILLPQLGHDIDARCLGVSGQFLKECFYSQLR